MDRRGRWAILAVVVATVGVIWVASAARGQEGEARAVAADKFLQELPAPGQRHLPSGELARRLEQKINVSLKDVSVHEALESLRRQVRVNLAWHPELKHEEDLRVELSVKDATLDSVLRTIARMTGLRVEYIGDIAYVGFREPPPHMAYGPGRPMSTLQVTLSEDLETVLTIRLTEDDLPPELREHMVHRALKRAGWLDEEEEEEEEEEKEIEIKGQGKVPAHDLEIRTRWDDLPAELGPRRGLRRPVIVIEVGKDLDSED